MMFVAPDLSAAVRTIALRGQNPFGAGEDASFEQFSNPSLNNRGQVAFGASLTGSDVSTANDAGYWIATGGTLAAVAREGASAPGMPAGTLFGNLFQPSANSPPLSDSGRIAVGRNVTLPDSTTSSGLWVGNDQELVLLAAQGGSAPGAENDATFLGLSTVRASINRRGDVAFNANLAGEPYATINSLNGTDGVWILNQGEPATAVLAGMNAEALGENAAFTGFRTFTYPALNRHGEAAFSVMHKLDANSPTTGNSIWVASANEVELRGVTGQPLPEFGENATLQFSAQPAINTAGAVAVNGYFNGSEGDPTSGTAIVVMDGAGTTLAASSGGPAPGTSYEFRSTFYEPSLGSGGHVAFFGDHWDPSVPNSSRSGVWAGELDNLQLIAVQGETAPNLDATFAAFIRNTPSINRFGQIAFPAGLVGEPSSSTMSLWATDLEGNLTLIARSGDDLEVAPGDVRTITSLQMITNHGDDDGRPRGLNDLGQIAFRANFSDNTVGIFVSDAVAHLPGDYNGNGNVDAADYAVWRDAMASQNLVADGNRDLLVDERDYELWKEFYGVSLHPAGGAGAALAVPEPASALLLWAALAAAFAAGMRRPRAG